MALTREQTKRKKGTASSLEENYQTVHFFFRQPRGSEGDRGISAAASGRAEDYARSWQSDLCGVCEGKIDGRVSTTTVGMVEQEDEDRRHKLMSIRYAGSKATYRLRQKQIRPTNFLTKTLSVTQRPSNPPPPSRNPPNILVLARPSPRSSPSSSSVLNKSFPVKPPSLPTRFFSVRGDGLCFA